MLIDTEDRASASATPRAAAERRRHAAAASSPASASRRSPCAPTAPTSSRSWPTSRPAPAAARSHRLMRARRSPPLLCALVGFARASAAVVRRRPRRHRHAGRSAGPPHRRRPLHATSSRSRPTRGTERRPRAGRPAARARAGQARRRIDHALARQRPRRGHARPSRSPPSSPASVDVPPLALRYRGAGRRRAATIQTPASRITVASVLPADGGDVEPRDLKPQAEIGSAPRRLDLLAVAVAASVALVVVLRPARLARPRPAAASRPSCRRPSCIAEAPEDRARARSSTAPAPTSAPTATSSPTTARSPSRCAATSRSASASPPSP